MSVNKGSAVEKIGSHEEFKSYFWRDWKFGNLGGAVGVPHFISEIHAHFLENVRGNLAKVDLVCLILGELSRSGQHCLDGS